MLKETKRVEWKDGVKWIYKESGNPDPEESEQTNPDCVVKYYAYYKCASCGREFSKIFKKHTPLKTLSHRPLCSSYDFKDAIARFLRGNRRGFGRLKRVEVFIQHIQRSTYLPRRM